MSLIERLKERKIVQWLIAYSAVAWGLMQGVDIIGDQFEWSLKLQQSITVALAFGGLITLVVAWYHGERGHQRLQLSEFGLIVVLLAGAGATITVLDPQEPVAVGTLAGLDFLEPDPNKVLVPPFRVAGATSALGYLHEGMMDLLNSRLSGSGGLRAVDPRTTMARLAEVLTEGQADPDVEQALLLAHALGAGFLLLGEVVGIPTEVSLSASLLEVPGGAEVGRATVTGPQDSLTVLVNQLAVAALQGRAGESRFAANAALPAIQAYLTGNQFFREGREVDAIVEFDRALAVDSTLTDAAFGLMIAGTRTGNIMSDAGERGVQVLRARERTLSPRDLAFLNAFDPITGFESERLAIKSVAAELNPERVEVWTLLAGSWISGGPFVGAPDWAQRARAALARAETLDPGDAGALMLGLGLRFATNDTVGVRDLWRRYSESNPDAELFHFYQWRVAVALNDEGTRDDVRESFADFTRNSVSLMAYHSILNGIPLADAGAATTVLASMAATDTEVGRVELPTRMIDRALGRISTVFDAQQLFLVDRTFLLLLEDYDEVKEEILTLAEGAPACINGFARAFMGDSTGVRALAAQEEANAAGKPANFAADQCPALLRAYIESVDGSDDRVALERADSIMRLGGQAWPEQVSNLFLARLFEARGEHERALETIRRRPYRTATPMAYYEPAFLREEGRHAALAGDTTGAIQAYRHYLTLRTDPDPGLQPEVNRVREALLALGGEPPGG